MDDDYQKRLEEARRPNREWRHAKERRQEMSEWDRKYLIRLETHGNRTPSLPTLSILNTDADIDPADLKAGESAAREAGLS